MRLIVTLDKEADDKIRIKQANDKSSQLVALRMLNLAAPPVKPPTARLLESHFPAGKGDYRLKHDTSAG